MSIINSYDNSEEIVKAENGVLEALEEYEKKSVSN